MAERPFPPRDDRRPPSASSEGGPRRDDRRPPSGAKEGGPRRDDRRPPSGAKEGGPKRDYRRLAPGAADRDARADSPGDPRGRVVFGIQPVRETLRAHGARVIEVTIESGDHPHLEALARFARDQGVAVRTLTRLELDRLARGARHQGAMAVAPPLQILTLDRVTIDDKTLLVTLDGIEDPQNFGAIVRSAVALGASGVLWAEHASAPLSPATFRASAGAVEHAALFRVAALPSAIQHLTEQGVVAVGLESHGNVELAQVDLRGPVTLVIGSEGKGLKKSVRNACTHIAKLPMGGAIDSLNASVAAAIALYEARRQRAV